MIKYGVDTKTIVKDHGAENIFRQIEALGKETVITSGIHQTEGAKLPTYNGKVDGKTPIVEYALYNEYGTKDIPSRPFLRQTVEKRKKQFARESEADMRRIVRGGSSKTMLEKNAKKIQKWIKATIWSMRTPPNAPATRRIKKRLGRGNNPLIFSNSMRESITSKVHKTKGRSTKLRNIIGRINKSVMEMKP